MNGDGRVDPHELPT